MKYELIAAYMAETAWSILPSKMHELLAVFAYRAAGHTFTREEIQARIGDGGASPAASKRGAVAVIPIRGVIAHRMGSMDDTSGGTSCERIAAMFRSAMADDSVGTILLDVDSPGGTVTGVAELADEIFAARDTKQIVAVANGLMASAAYHLASQAHEIVSLPSGMVGSIGVFYVHQSLAAALEKEGIDVTVISAGKYKTERLGFQPLTDDAKAVLQGQVDAAYSVFAKAVGRGRGVSAADVKAGYGEGRVLTGPDAKKAGLVDRVATMDETIGRLVGRKASAGLRAEGNEDEISAEIEALRAEQKRKLASLPNALAEIAAAQTDEDASREARLRFL